MRLPRKAFFQIIVMLLIATVIGSAPQSNYPVPVPVSPTSYKECDDFNTMIELRMEQLQRAAQQCDRQTHDACTPPGWEDHLGAAMQCIKENGGLWGADHMENTECGTITYGFPRCKSLWMGYECLGKSHWDQVRVCRAKVDAYLRSHPQQENPQDYSSPSEGSESQSPLARERQRTAAQQQAIQGATTGVVAALGTLLTKGTGKPLDSQSQLTDYDAQKQKQAVAGDDSDASLRMNDDLASLASNKDKQATQDTLGQDLDKLGSADQGASSDSATDGSTPADSNKEEIWDKARDIFQGFVDKASDNLADALQKAKATMNPEDFRKFEDTVGDAHSYLDGMSKTITIIKYKKDVEKIVENTNDPDAYHDIISDGASDGFSYVLKRLSPDFLSKIWEGPVGWFASITFDSSSTQTPQQDFDPMTALNNPSQYTFQQREAALQLLYQSAKKHPEVWSESKFKWLYSVSEKLYNSPDNPNIHLVPPSETPNPNINLTPQ